MDRPQHKIRRVVSREIPSYQLGHYEMYTAPSNGKRRSIFKVDVHLGEHPTIEEAIADWSEQISKLKAVGRENKAARLEKKLSKLDRLQELQS